MKKRINFNLDVEVYEALRKEAYRLDISMTQVIHNLTKENLLGEKRPKEVEKVDEVFIVVNDYNEELVEDFGVGVLVDKVFTDEKSMQEYIKDKEVSGYLQAKVEK